MRRYLYGARIAAGRARPYIKTTPRLAFCGIARRRVRCDNSYKASSSRRVGGFHAIRSGNVALPIQRRLLGGEQVGAAGSGVLAGVEPE